jgi:hypothetical protein
VSAEQFYGGLRVGAPGGSASFAPGTGPSFDWYIAPSGNDAAAGSSGAPWKTLARVKTELAKYSAIDQVRVYAAAGTYTGVNLDGSNFVAGGRLCLIAQSTTTLLAGTVAAGSTLALLNTSALGGTNNYFRKWIRRKSAGGVVLDERMISLNTATTITPSAAFMSAPVVGDTFEIFEPAFIIDCSAAEAFFTNFGGGGGGNEGFRPNYLFPPTAPAQMKTAGGLFLVDVRIVVPPGATPSSSVFFHNTQLYTKSLEIYAPASTSVSVNLSGASIWLCGVWSRSTGLSILSQFLPVAADDIWAGCGVGVAIAANSPLRVNGNFIGYIGCNTFYPNVNYPFDYLPFCIVCGGSIVNSGAICSNGFGLLTFGNSHLPPYPPTQIQTNTSPGMAFYGAYYGKQPVVVQYANIVVTGVNACVVSREGADVTIYSTVTGVSAGMGVDAFRGGTIWLNGALNCLGPAGADARVELSASPVAASFFSAAAVGHPATPVATGAKIVRYI